MIIMRGVHKAMHNGTELILDSHLMLTGNKLVEMPGARVDCNACNLVKYSFTVCESSKTTML